jgi:hypothetical protein
VKCADFLTTTKRLESKNNMTFTATKLNARHQKILDYCLAGHKQSDIAKQLSMSATQVNLIINAPNFQHELALRREVLQDVKNERLTSQEDPITEQLKRGALSAAMTLVNGLADESATTRIKSATEILDRTGHAKVQKIDANIKSATVVLKSEEAKALTDTLKMINNEPAN